MIGARVRVLIIDDSALVRRGLSQALAQVPDMEVVGSASDAYSARELIAQLSPDVLTLDVEMPRMNGLAFLTRLMRHYPMPVVIFSSRTAAYSDTALQALALGAIHVVEKPGPTSVPAAVTAELVRAIRVAAGAQVQRSSNMTPGSLNERQPIAGPGWSGRIIAIGASTGGTQAIECLLREFPADAPGTVIVQHMPELFTASFAKRLDSLCRIDVREASDGEAISSGMALVAPGGKHLIVQAIGAGWVARVKDGPRVHHQRPAVDVLFQSVARVAGMNASGALLTGMGNDGARGLLAMRKAGAFTIAQDEATSVVFGMPREAARLNAATEILPLNRIASRLLHRQSTAHAA